MSAKHTIFPPGRGKGGSSFDEDDLYTGQPDQDDPDAPGGQEQGPAIGPRGAAKGRAAYAAHENGPQPRNRAGSPFASGGGMFPGAPEESGEALQFSTGEGGDILSIVPDDRLREACESRICPSCQVKKEADDAQLRALAELDNAKKRLTREKEEHVRFAAESVLNDILPSLDNLDLALQHAGNHEGCKDFVIGVRMTRKLLQEALAKHGLGVTGAVGEEFNPALHEAVAMVNSPDVPDNHIFQLVSNGYTLNGRLLRPAKVLVCKKS